MICRLLTVFDTVISRGGGIRTPGAFQLNGFQDRRIRPLCHSSLNFNIRSRINYYNIFRASYGPELSTQRFFPTDAFGARPPLPITIGTTAQALPLHSISHFLLRYLSTSEFGGANLYLSVIPANAVAEVFTFKIAKGRPRSD